MIKVRVFWEKDAEIETAQRLTNALDSIIEAKQTQIGINRLGQRIINDPPQSFGINVDMRTATPPPKSG